MFSFLFGKNRLSRSNKNRIKKICKKMNIKTTRRVKGKRVNKTISQLKKEIKKKRVQKKSTKCKPKVSANGIYHKKGTDSKLYCLSKKIHLGSRPKWVYCQKSSFGSLPEEYPTPERWTSHYRTVFNIPIPDYNDPNFDPGHVTMGGENGAASTH